jgi:hypothetical protein
MNVALLIDCENANPESIDGILGELAEKGAINILTCPAIFGPADS